MKKIISLSIAIMATISSFGQVDRSKMPEPGPAREIKLGKYKTFTLKNGLKVIVVENSKLPRVTMSLVVDREPIFEGDKAGYVEIAGELMRRATTNRPKDELNEEVDFMGANISTSSTSVRGSGLSKYTEKILEIMADVTLNPAMPEEDFENILLSARSGIETAKESPSSIRERVFNAVLYGKNHPYGEDVTEETLDNISLEDCKAYYETYFRPNISYMAIVGDVKYKDIKKMVKKHFGSWEKADVPQKTYDFPEVPSSTQVSFSNRNSAVQSSIQIGNVINLSPGDPDIVKLRLANQILGGGSQGRLFQNLREDKAYTYGAYSSYRSDRLVGNFQAEVEVRNEVTDSAIAEILSEISKIREELVSEKDLQNAKNFINGTFGLSLESPSTLARFALDIERYGLDKNYYRDYLKNLNAVTPEDLREAARKYMLVENTHITIVGKASEVVENVKRFGEVQYYDYLANLTDEPSTPLPEGLTADAVIEKYLKATGGNKASKLKDFSMDMKVDMAGVPAPITGFVKKKAGKDANKYVQELQMQGMVVQRQAFDGKNGKTSSPMGEEEMGDAEKAEMMLEAEFFPEASYLAAGYKISLSHVEKIEDKTAYVVKVERPDGEFSFEFYDAESGLKLRSEKTLETPEGDIDQRTDYTDYKEVDGFHFPRIIKQKVGPQTLTIEVTDIKLNSNLKDADFSL